MPLSDTVALSSPALRQVRDAHLARLGRLFAGADDDDRVFTLCGLPQGNDDPPGEPAEKRVRTALQALAAQTDRALDAQVFRPLAVEFGLYGVHFADRLLGAEVFTLDGSWQARLLPHPVGELAPPDPGRNETWRQAQDLARAFLAAGATLPLFGLPTIGSALNIAVNLYGGAFLLAMLTSPNAARRDLGVINRLLCELHRWYRATLPADQLQPVVAAYRTQPPGFGQLCGCTTHLLSAELYRDFVSPLDDELLSVYPHGGMIHLCGAHTQHIPVWRHMRSLRAVQLNDRAAEDLAAFHRGLRPDQVIYVNPCPGMPVERILDITGGRRIVLVADLPEPPRKRPGPRLTTQ